MLRFTLYWERRTMVMLKDVLAIKSEIINRPFSLSGDAVGYHCLIQDHDAGESLATLSVLELIDILGETKTLEMIKQANLPIPRLLEMCIPA